MQNPSNESGTASRLLPTFLWKCLAFVMLIHETLSQAQQVYNCNTLVTSAGVTDLRTFAVGDIPTLCVHLLPFNLKVGFQITVDTYQAFTLRRNFEVVKNINTDFALQVSNSAALSQQLVK